MIALLIIGMFQFLTSRYVHWNNYLPLTAVVIIFNIASVVKIRLSDPSKRYINFVTFFQISSLKIIVYSHRDAATYHGGRRESTVILIANNTRVCFINHSP